MCLLKNTLSGFRLNHWSFSVTLAYFLKGCARETNIASSFFDNYHKKKCVSSFLKRWYKSDCFDFKGIKLPDILMEPEKFETLQAFFEDTFLFYCFYNDDYSRKNVELLDAFMGEGPYGYEDGQFDVTIKPGDVVLDLGAWIGDFAAYAAKKGSKVYAFEPVQDTYNYLCKTALLNGNIIPIKKGVGDEIKEIEISVSNNNSGANSLVINRDEEGEQVSIVTIDSFVEENQLDKVDFIKSDIEGSERFMLLGAKKTLKKFAPKLAICTYHLPDDPEVLENIIKEANPQYKVVHLKHKLFAMVIG